MPLIRAAIVAVGLLAVAHMAPAVAQTAKPSEPSTITKIEDWTAKQKSKIRRTWAKDKAKWAACRAKAKSEHWTRKNYWTSQYKCMTS